MTSWKVSPQLLLPTKTPISPLLRFLAALICPINCKILCSKTFLLYPSKTIWIYISPLEIQIFKVHTACKELADNLIIKFSEIVKEGSRRTFSILWEIILIWTGAEITSLKQLSSLRSYCFASPLQAKLFISSLMLPAGPALPFIQAHRFCFVYYQVVFNYVVAFCKQ